MDKHPLDIQEVQNRLADAQEAVERSIDSTNVMLEQAFLTEHVIQYANRYRSSYPALAVRLKEAEGYFRKSGI